VSIIKLKQFFFYAKYSIPFFIMQKEVPMILGMVITDRCNLSCKHCRVANTGRPDMKMEDIRRKLKTFYEKGFRELYIEGGEPYLWDDGPYVLDDIVDEAKRIGYFHVHIYTNGLKALKSGADMLWVSLDGLKDKYTQLRGDHFDRVILNIKESSHPKITVVHVINQQNKTEIEAFLEYVQSELSNVIGVIFYFHTPYYSIDELFIDEEERSEIIDKILVYKKAGLPVFNSQAGLTALKTGKWKRPNKTFAMTDIDGDYICCRTNTPEVCKHCGYGACTEVTEAQKWKISALMNLLKFW